MNRYLACLVGVCCLLIGCSDSENDSKKKASACDEQTFTQSCTSRETFNYCQNGEIFESACPPNQICFNGQCGEPCIGLGNQCDENNINVIACENNFKKIIPCSNGCQHGACKTDTTAQCQNDMQPYCNGSDLITCVQNNLRTQHCTLGCEQNKCIVLEDPPTLCNEKDYPKCNGDNLITCTDGKLETMHCENGCSKNACIPLVDPTIRCNEKDYPQCEDNSLLTCVSGILNSELCTNGCENNSCIDTPTPKESCGNNIIDAGEACDGKDIGKAKCADFVEKNMDQAVYTGNPVCNDTCTAVEAGTCAVTFCGNNQLDQLTHDLNNQVSEYCDEVNGVIKFRDNVTCADIKGYEGLEWESGGKPGCNKTCDGLSQGTCVLKSQPMFGIKQCAFTSLEKDESTQTVTGKARVVPVSPDASYDLLSGILACGHRENKTYTWGKTEARFMECADCAPGEFELIADFSYAAKSPDTYDCVFQVDINDSALEGGSNSNEFVNCPVIMGSPHNQKEDPTDAIIRTYTVDNTTSEGTLLAYWDFAGFKKYDKAASVKASDGIYATQSTVELSDHSEMQMYTNGGDQSNMAARGEEFSADATLSLEKDKHFSIKTSTKGYKNIRFKYSVAGSGDGTTKHIATAVNVLKIILGFGEELTFTDREFHLFPLTVVPDNNADDQTEVEFRIYPFGSTDQYGNEASNTTIRVDDIYVIGDPL